MIKLFSILLYSTLIIFAFTEDNTLRSSTEIIHVNEAYERNYSLSSSILNRLSIKDWDRYWKVFDPANISTLTDKDLPLCGSLQFGAWGYTSRNGLGGHQCYSGLVSFEICKQMLLSSKYAECNSLQFTDWDVFNWKKFQWWKLTGLCVLYDRKAEGFQFIKEPNFSNQIIVMRKLDSSIDNCTISNDTKPVSTALERFRLCHEINNSSRSDYTFEFQGASLGKSSLFSTLAEFAKLPRLHIVIMITEFWFEQNKLEMSKIASHWTCYAKVHGYNFTLSILPNMLTAEFFMRRHQYIAVEYMSTAQYGNIYTFNFFLLKIILNPSLLQSC
jgi:hypothetical protein